MPIVKEKSPYAVGELFAGIGGAGLAFKNAGFDIIWANEIDKKARLTYSLNFNHTLINDDMRNLDVEKLEKVDILTGGFPCQAFSIAGCRKGFKDERGSIFFDMIRYVDILKPRIVFLENVKHLTNHDEGRTFKIILRELSEAGYFVKFSVLNAACYSEIPQNRERVYIVCFRNKEDCDNFAFPDKAVKRREIKDFLEEEADDSFYYTNKSFYSKLKDKITDPNTVCQRRRVYARENKNNLCPTLTANMGTGGHNVPLILDSKGIRKLTPGECARLRGFPDNFKFPNNLSNSAKYKQIGNGVCVPVVERTAENIMKALRKQDGD
jgi:DNA (cytosine-5)-methyltransferase 1